LSQVICNNNENDNATLPEWIECKYFDRSLTENEDLGLVPNESMGVQSSAHHIARLVKGANRIVCISGAGISVESGIPPFRSGGFYSKDNTSSDVIIWNNFDSSKMTVQNFNNAANNEVAKLWWKMRHQLLPKVNIANPNPAHSFFGYLHQQNKLSAVITQNIDSLHQRGGVPHDKVSK
jgi:NAD-dependent deacetylase